MRVDDEVAFLRLFGDTKMSMMEKDVALRVDAFHNVGRYEGLFLDKATARNLELNKAANILCLLLGCRDYMHLVAKQDEYNHLLVALTGPNSYIIYKMLKARLNENPY